MNATARYFLIAAPGADGPGMAEAFLNYLEGQFTSRLGENTAACLLIAANEAGLSDSGNAVSRLQRIISGLQQRGVAVLLDDLSLAQSCGADGVHVTLDIASPDFPAPAAGRESGSHAPKTEADALSALNKACKAIKPNGIAGAGGLATRHLAMSAGECDLDYVMFGEADSNGKYPGLAAVQERTAWWSELFTVPCVAYAPDADAVGVLASCGADFIAVDAAFFETIDDPMALLQSGPAEVEAVEAGQVPSS